MRIRGVSPVVATSLLILIAVVAAAILYLWVTGAVSTQSGGQDVLYERIKIDAVSYANGSLAVYVRNVGDVSTNISAVYVLSSKGAPVANNTSVNIQLAPGQVQAVNFTDVTLKPGEVYVVKAVTAKGVEATYTIIIR